MARGTVNKVILVGKLGQDPEVRTIPQSGAQVTNLNIATNDGYRNKDTGQWEDSTEWHRVVCFGRTAEIAAQYLRKGGSVYLEGRLRTNKWQDKEGNNRYTTEIIANQLELLGGRNDQASGDMGASHAGGFGAQSQQPVQAAGFAGTTGGMGQTSQAGAMVSSSGGAFGGAQQPSTAQVANPIADPMDDEIPF